jgi:hypothetical protein
MRGKKLCESCLGKRRRRVEDWLRQGLCERCREHLPVFPGRRNCLPCLYKTHEDGVEKRKLSSEIDFERFKQLVALSCWYCNKPNAGGIDRVKNEFGYTTLNSVPCCSDCNFLKGSFSAPDFYRICGRIIEFSATYEEFKPRWHALTRPPEGETLCLFSSTTATPALDQPSISNAIH